MECTSKVTIHFDKQTFEEGDIVKVTTNETVYEGKIISAFTDAISLDYSQKYKSGKIEIYLVDIKKIESVLED